MLFFSTTINMELGNKVLMINKWKYKVQHPLHHSNQKTNLKEGYA